MSLRTDPAWNLAGSQFNKEEMLSSPMLACRVTPKIGTRHGFIAKIPLRLTRIHCQVIVSSVTQNIIFLKRLPLLNVQACPHHCKGQGSTGKWVNWHWLDSMLGFLVNHTLESPIRLNVYLHGWYKGSIAPQLYVFNWGGNQWNDKDPSEWRSGRLQQSGSKPFCKLNPPPEVSL